ncbi:WD40 repeat domain-containing protein [Streptomyces sp. A1-5]|uniref:WD40 repeat domain-containing protein n=1 Tax=Streptomyces sp. A1-5 TaxID=2738410 RepID=UPI001F2A8448|nr:hypothetical protein [Streptomyces sp. A1-5]UJB46075.1 hypothetical protein HRD51_39805 [Streptomyces sp. A1-5]
MLTGHRNNTEGAAFAPDGHVLATTSQDRTVRLWDVSDRRHPHTTLAVLTGHTNAVYGVAFNHDGHVLASADTTARLWETDPTRAAARICATAHPSLTRSDWDHFFSALPCRPPC